MKKIETMLKGQSSMRVVLNGGKYELEDATIPFQIGFDLSVANLKPTHILVVDVTDQNQISGKKSGAYLYDSTAERTLFKLEPIHYLQLKKPGVHHLIFILLSGMDKETRQFLFEKSYYGYENGISYGSIEEVRMNYQIAYVESVVDVPKEFFADEPETRFQKTVYRWVNSWYKLKPVDECEYRKRKIIGFTIKPLLWLLGLIPRIVSSIFLQAFFFAFKVVTFFFGLQPVSFFPNKKEVWIDFLFKYPILGYKDVFKADFWIGEDDAGNEEIDSYGFKTLAIGKKRFYTPLTLGGVSFHLSCLYFYFFSIRELLTLNVKGVHVIGLLLEVMLISAVLTVIMVLVTLPTLKKSEEWKYKWKTDTKRGKKNAHKTANWIFFPMVVILLLALAMPYISWTDFHQFLVIFSKIILIIAVVLGISLFISKKLSPIISKKINEIKKKVKIQETILKEEKVNIDDLLKMEWLQKSFDIEKLPERVSFKTAPASSNVLHEFTISFWRLKAKVCKPYAKK